MIRTTWSNSRLKTSRPSTLCTKHPASLQEPRPPIVLACTAIKVRTGVGQAVAKSIGRQGVGATWARGAVRGLLTASRPRKKPVTRDEGSGFLVEVNPKGGLCTWRAWARCRMASSAWSCIAHWAARRRVAGKAWPLGDRVLGGLPGGIETLSFTALIASAILNSAGSPAC